MSKIRIDLLLVERGFAETQEKAAAMVMAGEVSVNGVRVLKPGTPIEAGREVSVAEPSPYVSRGGLKLERALDAFSIDVTGRTAADVGASTGGFTDCLLKRGARRVYAIDVGRGLLDWRLRTDARVVVLENRNARYGLDLPEKVDLVTIDVSFISVCKVIPQAAAVLNEGGAIIVLVKPQFEAQRDEVGKGGVIRDAGVHAKVLARFLAWANRSGFSLQGLEPSPIPGASGNREFFVLLSLRVLQGCR